MRIVEPGATGKVAFLRDGSDAVDRSNSRLAFMTDQAGAWPAAYAGAAGARSYKWGESGARGGFGARAANHPLPYRRTESFQEYAYVLYSGRYYS